MAKPTYRPTPLFQLFLAALVGLLIGVGIMVKLNKKCFNSLNFMSGESESLSNGDDVPALEKDLQMLKSTNPFKN